LNLSVPKGDFRKCHRWPQHRLPLGCELREQVAKIMLATQKISGQVEYITDQLVP
jgi:hypothetical protein